MLRSLRPGSAATGIRCFSSVPIASNSNKRIPSFADIHAGELDKYKAEYNSLHHPTLAQLRHDAKVDGEKAIRKDESLAPKLFKSFLYGSSTTKAETSSFEESFSKKLMRGKYVHEIVTHKVIPGKALEYLDLVTNLYPKIASNDKFQVHLVGSWRTLIGDMDTYTHIWEYKGYQGFHHTQNAVHADEEYLYYLEQLRPLLRSRESDLMQEFDFWGGTAQPHNFGGIFELRTYDIFSGRLLEWEQHWRKGLECRKQVMEPVGAWFTQLGHLNRVQHLWQFADLEHRKISREKCWELPGWADTVHETVKLIDKMESNILIPLKFSPLK